MKFLTDSFLNCSACRARLAPAYSSRATGLRIPRRAYTRPTFAPKPALDIKHIRLNPGLYSQNCVDRNYGAHKDSPWKIVELHNDWLALQQSARKIRERNNLLRRQLAEAAGRSGDAEGDIRQTADKDALMREARELKAQLGEIEEKESVLQSEMERLAQDLPNLSSTETPVGEEAEVIEYINDHPEPEPSQSDRVWRSHVHIGAELGLMDFAGAAQTSGWGWYYLVGEGAMLEQALVQYALSVARKRGWKAVAPPSIVYSHIAAACGFQPRDQNGEQQVYAIEQAEKDRAKPPMVLAGTAEIPLAGMKANQTLEDSELPLKTVGVSRCYRAEAGARGVDTKGLYRVHEFTKVEMFAWTLPDQDGQEHFTVPAESSSQAVFDEMLSMQKEILESLGLHCRVLEMPTTDLGASATRKRDIEAYFPSRREKDSGWGEVTSTSMCTDYQTRRLHTRVRLEKTGRKLDFPYTLNGTALAVPRVLAAILENHWNERDYTVTIPEVLRPFMGGLDKIQGHKEGPRPLSSSSIPPPTHSDLQTSTTSIRSQPPTTFRSPSLLFKSPTPIRSPSLLFKSLLLRSQLLTPRCSSSSTSTHLTTVTMPVKAFTIIRHAQTKDDGAENPHKIGRTKTGNWADIMLSATGEQQARETAERILRDFPEIDVMYVAPQVQCIATAYFIRHHFVRGGRPRMPIRVENGFRDSTFLDDLPVKCTKLHYMPKPTPIPTLFSLFPSLDQNYESIFSKPRKGWPLDYPRRLLHRIAIVQDQVVRFLDKENKFHHPLVITHAPIVLTMARVLTDPSLPAYWPWSPNHLGWSKEMHRRLQDMATVGIWSPLEHSAENCAITRLIRPASLLEWDWPLELNGDKSHLTTVTGEWQFVPSIWQNRHVVYPVMEIARWVQALPGSFLWPVVWVWTWLKFTCVTLSVGFKNTVRGNPYRVPAWLFLVMFASIFVAWECRLLNFWYGAPFLDSLAAVGQVFNPFIQIWAPPLLRA
ncbi:seryl-tRNA synthetase [Sporormia fimetaria CBS 119925]|uniref:serine--tRNA ligase n=1 Tax=Sporormia fimetaria CBS 119925 TaxID=1340428 RepID=A0A6A6VJ84_9PLEO|nr:seryl-tRNA synthetase [Sporormia fimetaria CBS 119925]